MLARLLIVKETAKSSTHIAPKTKSQFFEFHLIRLSRSLPYDKTPTTLCETHQRTIFNRASLLMEALKSLVAPLVGGVAGNSVVDGMKLVRRM